MKKKIIGFITLMLMLAVFSGSAFAMVTNNIEIYTDNSKLNIPEGYGNPFIDDKNRTQVPLRVISEKLGRKVEWNNDTQTAIIDGEILVKIGDNKVTTPSGVVTMDTKAVVIEGRTYVPLRFVIEALGYEVGYEFTKGYHKIDIFSPQPVVDGDVIVIDISDVEVPTYTQVNGKIRIDKVGSTENSLLGTREESSTYADDLEKFNQALKGSTWKVASAGSLQWENQQGNDPNALLVIDRKDNNPRVKIRGWAINDGDEQLTPITMVMNTFVESAKYYSSKPSDGEAIFWYVNKAVEEGKDVPVGKVMQFGDTKIIFEDPNTFGIDVIFLN